MTDKHLDGAIVRAVREMMSVDADPGFRARVFGRIEQPRRRGIGWLRIAIAGGAAAAIVLAVVLTWTPGAPQRTAVRVAATNPAPAPVLEPQEPTVPPVTQPSTGRVAGRRAPGPRQVRASQAQGPNVTQQVAAGALVATVADVDPPSAAEPESAGHMSGLPEIQPIAIAPLESASIAPSPILITPLSFTEVQIEPLFPRVQRD